MARIAAHGRARRVESGDVLLEIGESGRIFTLMIRVRPAAERGRIEWG